MRHLECRESHKANGVGRQQIRSALRGVQAPIRICLMEGYAREVRVRKAQKKNCARRACFAPPSAVFRATSHAPEEIPARERDQPTRSRPPLDSTAPPQRAPRRPLLPQGRERSAQRSHPSGKNWRTRAPPSQLCRHQRGSPFLQMSPHQQAQCEQRKSCGRSESSFKILPPGRHSAVTRQGLG